MSEGVTLTFDRSASKHILDVFDWSLTNFGYLRDSDDILSSVTGHPVHINEFAGVVEYGGKPRPLRDDFNELIEYVKYRREQEVDDD